MKKLLLFVAVIVGLSSFTVSGPFSSTGKKVMFRLDNSDSSVVSFQVMDSKGRVVYSDQTNEKQVGKLFNFEGAFSDDYVIIVKDGPETYKRIVSVD